MSKKAYTAIGIIALLIFLTLIYVFEYFNDAGDNAVILTVNGEPLYNYQVDRVVSQSKRYERSEIIETSIDDLLLIQYAQANGCEVSDEEVSAKLQAYKESLPAIYELAVDRYGINDLKSGLKNMILIDRAKDLYLSSNASKSYSETELDEYLIKNDIAPEQLTEEQYDLASQEYIEITLINSLLSDLRSTASIIYIDKQIPLA